MEEVVFTGEKNEGGKGALGLKGEFWSSQGHLN